MSTQCRIARQLPDGTYRGVTCHFDGYPSNIVPTLKLVKESEIDNLLSKDMLVFRREWVKKGKETVLEAYIEYEYDDADFHLFNTLQDLLESKSTNGFGLGVAHTYIYKDGQWFGHYPYYDMEIQPIDNYIPYLKEFCSDGDDDIEW
jgi:hypothetical protein